VVFVLAIAALGAGGLPLPFGVATESMRELVAWAPVLAALVASPLVTAALTRMALSAVANDDFSVGASVAHGYRDALRVLPVSLAVTAVTALGYAACFVPGVIFSVLFFVVVPTAVMENVGVGAAFQRGVARTRGRRIALFAIVVALGLFDRVTSSLGGVLADDPREYPWLFAMVSSGVVVLQTIAHAFVAAVCYLDLRRTQEGTDEDALLAALGFTPGRAASVGAERMARAVDASLAQSAQSTAREDLQGSVPPAMVVADDALETSRKRRDARLARFGMVAGVVTLAAVLLAVVGGIQQRRALAKASAERRASLLATLETARGRDLDLVGRAVAFAQRDVYGAMPTVMTALEAENENALLTALGRELAEVGCEDAVEQARTGPSYRRATIFAEACGACPIADGPELARVSLPQLALLTALEARAAKRRTEADPLHRAIASTLMAIGT
jgi:hypothetical protein